MVLGFLQLSTALGGKKNLRLKYGNAKTNNTTSGEHAYNTISYSKK